MNRTFETSRFFNHQTTELMNNGLKIKRKSMFDYHEYEISFENLENKKSVTSQVNHGFLVFAFFFIVVGLLYLSSANYGIFFFLLLIAITITIIAFTTKKKIVKISGHQYNLELFFSKSNENEVRLFADEIINSSNKYLLNKYGKVDKDLPIENQLINIEFLKNRDIIDEEKYQELKNQLIGKDNKKIGYNN